MERVEINKNGNKITLFGSKSITESEKDIINNLDLTGNESKDRLILQQCIDDNRLKSSISYNGNTVYSCDKIVKQYRQLQKTGTLEKLTENLYNFFMNACDDIAHYNINGYKDYYCNSLRKLENELLKNVHQYTNRFSDRDNIFKILKIGKYFEERNKIDVNSVSIKKLKEFINDCGFKVDVNKNSWIFTIAKKNYNVEVIEQGTNITYHPIEKNAIEFSFKIDVNENKPSNVIHEITDYYKNFNKDNYISEVYEANKIQDNAPTISEIVYNTDYFVSYLSKLADNLTYKCKCEAEILSNIVCKEEKLCDFELELEM